MMRRSDRGDKDRSRGPEGRGDRSDFRPRDDSPDFRARDEEVE